MSPLRRTRQATVYQSFNEGKAAAANDASFYLFTLAEGDQSALKAGSKKI